MLAPPHDDPQRSAIPVSVSWVGVHKPGTQLRWAWHLSHWAFLRYGDYWAPWHPFDGCGY